MTEEEITEAVAREVCRAWGHCAEGCPLRGEPCKGLTDRLMHDWQGRVASAVVALLGPAPRPWLVGGGLGLIEHSTAERIRREAWWAQTVAGSGE